VPCIDAATQHRGVGSLSARSLENVLNPLRPATRSSGSDRGPRDSTALREQVGSLLPEASSPPVFSDVANLQMPTGSAVPTDSWSRDRAAVGEAAGHVGEAAMRTGVGTGCRAGRVGTAVTQRTRRPRASAWSSGPQRILTSRRGRSPRWAHGHGPGTEERLDPRTGSGVVHGSPEPHAGRTRAAPSRQ
jgi:hypothetical protein